MRFPDMHQPVAEGYAPDRRRSLAAPKKTETAWGIVICDLDTTVAAALEVMTEAACGRALH